MFRKERLEHPEKAFSSMEVTLFGIIKEERLEHPEKAPFPIVLIVLGMIVLGHPNIRILVDDSIIALQSFRESYVSFSFSTEIFCRP